MDIQQLKRAVAKPEVAKLKAVGKGIRVGLVWGRRLLVKPVVPYTDMDEVEKRGLLVVPETVKEQNTPRPSTGIVVQSGLGLIGDDSDGVYFFKGEGTNVERLINESAVFAPGTGVLFSKFAGTDFVIDKVDYKILHLDEIMATFELEEETGEIIVPVAE